REPALNYRKIAALGQRDRAVHQNAMPIHPSMFKAYDIRALSPEELDEDVAYRVGQAYVKLTGAKRVVVGKDMRGTTPALFDALAKGLNSQGCDVVDIGLITTPMLYFATGEHP